MEIRIPCSEESAQIEKQPKDTRAPKSEPPEVFAEIRGFILSPTSLEDSSSGSGVSSEVLWNVVRGDLGPKADGSFEHRR